MRASRVVWIAMFIVACDESQSEPAIGESDVLRRRCSELRDHVVDLRVADVTIDREQHRNALRNALGDGFVSDCVESYSSDAIECAIASPNNDEIGQCLAATAEGEK